MKDHLKNQYLNKKISSQEISQVCKSLTLIKTADTMFANILPPNLATADTLVFVNSEALLTSAIKQNAAGIIVTEKLAPLAVEQTSTKTPVWSTPNVHLAMTEVLPLFDQRTTLNSGHHPTAFISKTAQIGQNVTIEPYAVIGDNVVIGDHSIIGAHCILETGATIGHHTRLSGHVFIGYNCSIGHHCLIGPQNVIGSDGFGFFTDKTGTHHKIPQIGRVIIEDHCELGAQCAIDRAALTETRIRKGSKFDNFIHIAHNCDIGENALITAGFIIAGSSKVGRNLTTAGGTHITGHVTVADNVILTGRTGVVSNIEKSGIYGGFPQTDHKESLRIMTSLASLPKIRKQVTQILKHLGLDKE